MEGPQCSQGRGRLRGSHRAIAPRRVGPLPSHWQTNGSATLPHAAIYQTPPPTPTPCVPKASVISKDRPHLRSTPTMGQLFGTMGEQRHYKLQQTPFILALQLVHCKRIKKQTLFSLIPGKISKEMYQCLGCVGTRYCFSNPNDCLMTDDLFTSPINMKEVVLVNHFFWGGVSAPEYLKMSR